MDKELESMTLRDDVVGKLNYYAFSTGRSSQRGQGRSQHLQSFNTYLLVIIMNRIVYLSPPRVGIKVTLVPGLSKTLLRYCYSYIVSQSASLNYQLPLLLYDYDDDVKSRSNTPWLKIYINFTTATN